MNENGDDNEKKKKGKKSEIYPMWNYGTVDQIQLIHPHDVNKKILGMPVLKSPLFFLFDEDFRV